MLGGLTWRYPGKHHTIYNEENIMTKTKLGLIGPIIKDNHGHECNGECKGSIHVIYKRGA